MHNHGITYESLLEGNKEFVAEALREDPAFFDKLSAGQTPPILWIGCSDSRVPANQITHTQPGDIFVHRNISNVVIHTDMNMLSVLDYAVNILEVSHVIVCGHYGCGGIKAAMENKQFGIIDNWLCHIKDIYRVHHEEIDAIADEKARLARMVELNVTESVFNVAKTSIIQNRWAAGKTLGVHGWAYSLETGIITDLKVSLTDNKTLSKVFNITEE